MKTMRKPIGNEQMQLRAYTEILRNDVLCNYITYLAHVQSDIVINASKSPQNN